MAMNTIEYATIFQKELDNQMPIVAASGWMETNAQRVIYNGGAEVKMPE